MSAADANYYIEMPQTLLADQRIPLLVFAVSGRIGSGASFVAEKLCQQLRTYEYDVEFVDVSTLILATSMKKGDDTPADLVTLKAEFAKLHPKAAERVTRLQDLGNELRSNHGADILAALCITEGIAPAAYVDIEKGTRKAFIIDSLKHPSEADLLRRVFGDAFYHVGVVASDDRRYERLKERKGFSRDELEQLSDRDADEHGRPYGQRAVETVVGADYLFSNDYASKDEIVSEADRLLRLVFGVGVVTPRQDEYAMHIAFKAALRSACLSRQVGAAIFSKEGVVLGTGHNDVPRAGGGLYSGDSPASDARCWTRGAKCYNDEEKRLIAASLVDQLIKSELIPPSKRDQAESVILSSRIKGLIEFSRAVHGEMEAIVSVARSGVGGMVGATLYCTTYPCHTCAKHIIGGGLARVVYLEPYEKSLASKLHSDAWCASSSENQQQDRRVRVELYGGVAPRRYEQFFRMHDRKDKQGRFVDRDRTRNQLTPNGGQEGPLVRTRIEQLGLSVDRKLGRKGGGANGGGGREDEAGVAKAAGGS